MIKFLQRVIADDALHMRWLNTLAYMEYVGARKIMKSQHEDDIDENLLAHMAEEINHAYFLKKLVRKNFLKAATKFSEQDLLAKSSAKKYLQSIDAYCALHAPNVNHAYMLSSFVIETRALLLYSTYGKLLQETNLFRLTSILKQEERHLQEMEEALHVRDQDFSVTKEKMRHFEERSFSNFLCALNDAVTNL